MTHPVLTGVLLTFLSGCTVANPTASPRDGDAALYESEIQPIVSKHCAFLGCHGREGMPLALYAVDYLRLHDPEGTVDPSRPALDERALTGGEMTHNRRALAARVGERDPAADKERLIRTLVSTSAGGISHAGVTVFESIDAPELATLRRFLDTVE